MRHSEADALGTVLEKSILLLLLLTIVFAVAVVATITQVCPNAQAPDRRRPNGWPRVEGT